MAWWRVSTAAAGGRRGRAGARRRREAAPRSLPDAALPLPQLVGRVLGPQKRRGGRARRGFPAVRPQPPPPLGARARLRAARACRGGWRWRDWGAGHAAARWGAGVRRGGWRIVSLLSRVLVFCRGRRPPCNAKRCSWVALARARWRRVVWNVLSPSLEGDGREEQKLKTLAFVPLPQHSCPRPLARRPPPPHPPTRACTNTLHRCVTRGPPVRVPAAPPPNHPPQKQRSTPCLTITPPPRPCTRPGPRS